MSYTISSAGLKSLERQLESLNQKLLELRRHKNKIAVDNGNAWHDNNDFEQSEIDERRILREIADIKEKINTATVISESNSNLSIVDYGAKVDLSIKDNECTEFMSILFSDSDEPSAFQKISANSPLGKAIFHQETGFIGSYKVGVETFEVKILKIEY